MNTETAILIRSQLRQRRVDKFKKWISHVPAYLILGVWSLFIFFMFVWVILASLKTNKELYTDVWALPDQLHFENYTKALFTVNMGAFFLNSLVVVLPSVLMILVLSAPASY